MKRKAILWSCGPGSALAQALVDRWPCGPSGKLCSPTTVPHSCSKKAREVPGWGTREAGSGGQTWGASHGLWRRGEPPKEVQAYLLGQTGDQVEVLVKWDLCPQLP